MKPEAKEVSPRKVLAIAALTLDDTIEDEWSHRWATALKKSFPHRWRELASTAGDGLRKLLNSSEDLQEANYFCANGLLSRRNVTAAQLNDIGRRLLVFAVEPLEQNGKAARAGSA
jgi:hypothetical protein